MIPLRTDRRLKHTPWANTFLIAANVVAYVVTHQQITQIDMAMAAGMTYPQLKETFPVFSYFLHPYDPHWWQYLTYQFIHGGFFHILFNMLFLYVFGNSLNDRLGTWGYLFFYLGGGVVAGLGHSLTSDNPVIGASGAVSAVTGGFLALFPLSHVVILWMLGLIFITEWPSVYFILFAFIKDLFFEFSSVGGNVAYLAHISGNIFGFVVCMFLLISRILEREEWDMLMMLSHWNRRRKYRAAFSHAPGPWQSDAPGVMDKKQLTPKQEQVIDLRAAIQNAYRAHQLSKAVELLAQLQDLDPEQVMPLPIQLDLASYAMHEKHHVLAAHTCESFLRAYPSDDKRHEIQLMLGLLYGRYLNQPERARGLLEEARDNHPVDGRRKLAAQLLEELKDS